MDVDAETLNINTDLIESAITRRTRAILSVNLLGNPCNYSEICMLAQKHDLLLIEDCCESLGATFSGRNVGTFGVCGTFSTFYSHHISTMEGGVVVTDDERLYHVLLCLRAHGWLRDQPPHSHLNHDVDGFLRMFRFILPGYNVRPLEIEGAVGKEQLRKLLGLIRGRRENASLFLSKFANLPYVAVQKEVGKSSWFGFALILKGRLAGRRRELVARLEHAGIECRPIVAGNFTANPVMSRLNFSMGSSAEVAENIDNNGLFVGNNHYPLGRQLERAHAIVADAAKEGM